MTKPSFYSPELAAEICERIALGGSLRTVCAAEDMPSRESVRRWLKEHEGFQPLYDAARQERTDAMLEDMLAVADDPAIDPNDKKVRIATRQWIMARMAPKRFGDKVEHTGRDGGPILTEDVTPLERARLIAFALEKAARLSEASRATSDPMD